jgi:hypothetical protein
LEGFKCTALQCRSQQVAKEGSALAIDLINYDADKQDVKIKKDSHLVKPQTYIV